jgi:cyclic pyranopterin phosphate synthase
MPKDVFDKQYQFLPHSDLLTFEEITRVAAQFVAHGVRKIRLTGGEPLLRKNIETLIAMLAALRTPDGEEIDLTLTTNGTLLKQKAQALKAAGLRRVTVSLDSLDDESFRRMNDVDFPVRACWKASKRRTPPDSVRSRSTWWSRRASTTTRSCPWRATSRAARPSCASSNTWTWAVPTAGAWTKCCPRPSGRRIAAEMPWRWPTQLHRRDRRALALRDGGGEIGVISSVTQAFCQDCSRARLSTEGQVYTCLFASQGHDLRSLVRNGGSDADCRCHRRPVGPARRPLFRAARRQRPRRARSRCLTSAAIRHACPAPSFPPCLPPPPPPATSPAWSWPAGVARAWAASTRACNCCMASRWCSTCWSAWRPRSAPWRSTPTARNCTTRASAIRSGTTCRGFPARWRACKRPGALHTPAGHRPCDSPLIPYDLVAHLADAMAGAEAAIAVTVGRRRQRHPVCSLSAPREAVAGRLPGGRRRKMERWFATLHCVEVDFPSSAPSATSTPGWICDGSKKNNAPSALPTSSAASAAMTPTP